MDALRKAFKGIVEENEKNLKSLADNMGGDRNPIWDFIKSGLEDILLYKLLRKLRNLLKRFPKPPVIEPPITKRLPAPEPPATKRLPAPEPTSTPSRAKALPAPEPTSTPSRAKALPAPEGTPALPGKGAPALEPPVNATVNAPRLTPAPTGGTTIEMGKGTTGSYTEVKGFSTATPRPTGAASTIKETATRILTPLEEFSPGIAAASKALGVTAEIAGPIIAGLQIYFAVKSIKDQKEYLQKSLEYAAITGNTVHLQAAVTMIAESENKNKLEKAENAPNIISDDLVLEETTDWSLNKDKKIKESFDQQLKLIPKIKEELIKKVNTKSEADKKQKKDKADSLKAAEDVNKLNLPFLKPIEPEFNLGKMINSRSKENEDLYHSTTKDNDPSKSVAVQNNTSGSTEESSDGIPAQPVNDESTRSRSIKSSTRRY